MESKEKKFIICRSDVYIEPVSECNMKKDCKLCYTKKRKGKHRKIIPKEQILDFMGRFADFSLRGNLERKIKAFWCGTGEIFMHDDFPEVVNELNREYGQRIKHEIMTNGTIDRLDEFDDLSNVKFYVSIHGPIKHNDWIRGKGTYGKSVDFCRKAYELGCEKLGVRTLVTKKNILLLNDFQKDLNQKVGRDVRITLVLPHSAEEIERADSKLILKRAKTKYSEYVLFDDELRKILKQTYGRKFDRDLESNWAAYLYPSLNYYGVYNCSEGIIRIGDINTPMNELFRNLRASKEKCLTSCPLIDGCYW